MSTPLSMPPPPPPPLQFCRYFHIHYPSRDIVGRVLKLSGYIHHILQYKILCGWVAGKSLSGLYLRNVKVYEADTWSGTLVRRCRCATSRSDLYLTFDLAVVTLSLKIFSGLYLRNHKVLEVFFYFYFIGHNINNVTI